MELDFLRIVFAFICGHAICLSGSLTQIVTSNSLASPSTLGFDGLVVLVLLVAHFFTTFVFEFSLGFTSYAFFLSLILIGAAFTKLRPLNQGQLKMNQVILMGLGFNLLIGAVFAVVQFLFMAMNYQFPSGLWFGNFRAAGIEILWVLAPTLGIALAGSWSLAKSLGLINVDTTIAQSLGVDVGRTQKKALVLALFLTGSTICFFGVFSFLGLILPHLMRNISWFRGKIRNELLYAPIVAGTLLSILDQLCYNFTFYGAELPVGMVSSVLGSLLLVLIVMKKLIS